jgi:type II secretory pathway pseudopilin PulG
MTMSQVPQAPKRAEEGIALLVTVVLLLLLSAIGVTALQRAQDETVGGGSSRRKVSMLLAADSALHVVEAQLASAQTQFPDVSPLDDAQFINDNIGLPLAVRTGSIDSSTSVPIQKVGTTYQEGGQINVNSPNTFSYGVYRTGVVVTDPGGGNVQLQAQYSVLEGASSYK